MARSLTTIIDCSTGETITREMTQEEYDAYLLITAQESPNADAAPATNAS